MYRLLIVEDEPLLLNGLVKTIDWASIGFEIAGTASSAEHALPLLQQRRPDVMLTDIVMPERDGLWLLEHARDTLPGLRAVILSNHAQFNYAHRAIQLGVFDYVMKLELYDKLPQVFSRLKMDLDESRRMRGGESDELSKALDGHSDTLSAGRTRHGVVVCARMPHENAARGLKELGVPYTRRGGLFVAATAGKSPDALRMQTGKAVAALGSDIASGVCFGRAEEPISDCYLKAAKMLDYARLSGACACYFDVVNPGLKLYVDNRKEIDAAVTYLLGGNPAMFAEAIKSAIVNCVHARDTLIGAPRAMLAGMFGRLTGLYTSHQVKDIFDDYIHAIYGIDSMVDLMLFVEKNGAELEHHLEEYRKLSVNNMNEVLAYVDEHLTTDMRMEDVARQFFMSPPYFSVQFKKRTGVKFVDYVKSRHLEKAAEYLKETSLTVTEVADLVGYQDAKHFSRIFREKYGILPNEYKARLK